MNRGVYTLHSPDADSTVDHNLISQQSTPNTLTWRGPPSLLPVFISSNPSLPLISLSLSCKQSLEYAEDATEQRLTSPTAAVCSSRRAAATLRPASSAAVVRHPASGGSALFGRTGRGGVLSGGATATPPTRTGSRRTLGLQPNQAREALFWRCWLLPGARTAPQEATHASCSPVLLVAQRGRRASRPAVRDSPRCSSRLLYVGFA